MRPMHTLLADHFSLDDRELLIEGDEAEHALRSKRLRAGEAVRVINGRGAIARGTIIDAKRRLTLRIEECHEEPPIEPRVDVWSATPKGPRIAELVEGLVQCGAASWSPMSTAWGVVDPRESKLARLERVVAEATKQSARAWLMKIGHKRAFEEALAPEEGCDIILADARGPWYHPVGAPRTRLLVGPEGGFTEKEVESARQAGARLARFAACTMRIETAAPIAAGVVLFAARGPDRPRG